MHRLDMYSREEGKQMRLERESYGSEPFEICTIKISQPRKCPSVTNRNYVQYSFIKMIMYIMIEVSRLSPRDEGLHKDVLLFNYLNEEHFVDGSFLWLRYKVDVAKHKF